MPSEEDSLYAIDEDSWNKRQQGRSLHEVVREPIQNSMDTGSDIKIQLNYEDSSVVVEDYDDEGVQDLGNFYTLFDGTKAGNPEKRGRFGRGTKELVGASDEVVISSTGGAVRFDVEQGSRITYENAERDRGTVVYASNSDWGEEDLDEVKDFVHRLMPEEGMEIKLEDDRGYEAAVEYEEPDAVYDAVLETAEGEDRRTAVEVKTSERGMGGIYEMGIPVTWSEDFPYSLNVQQTVRMAEQRQDVDSDYRRELMHSLLKEEMDLLQDSELTESYVTENLVASRRLPEDVEKEYLKRRFNKPVNRLVVSSFPQYDDKAEQSGYEVLHTPEYDGNVSFMMKNNLKTTKELVEHLQETDEVDKDIEPSEVQQKFLDFVEDEVIDPIWSWSDAEPGGSLYKTLGRDSRSRTPLEMGEKPDVDIAFRNNEEGADRWAFYDHMDHTIYFNVAETDDNWEDLRLGYTDIMDVGESFVEQHDIETEVPEPQRIGVAIHEAAHAEADSLQHDKEWYKTMELMAGTLLQKLMMEKLEDDDLGQQLEQEQERRRSLEEEVERLEQEVEDSYEGPLEYIRDKAGGLASRFDDFVHR